MQTGDVVEADFDVVLKRLFRVRLRLGHFDTSSPLDSIGQADVCNVAGRELGKNAKIFQLSMSSLK